LIKRQKITASFFEGNLQFFGFAEDVFLNDVSNHYKKDIFAFWTEGFEPLLIEIFLRNITR